MNAANNNIKEVYEIINKSWLSKNVHFMNVWSFLLFGNTSVKQTSVLILVSKTAKTSWKWDLEEGTQESERGGRQRLQQARNQASGRAGFDEMLALGGDRWGGGERRAPLPPPAVRPPVIAPATMRHGRSGRHRIETRNIIRCDAHQVRLVRVLVKPSLNASCFFSKLNTGR